MTVDARALQLTLDEGAGMGRQPALSFKGLARFGVPKDSGGYAGSLVVNGPAQGLEILAAGQAPILGPKAAAIQASDLNALSAGAMFLGGTPGRGVYDSGQMDVYAKNTQLLVRSGAVLSAPEIFLYAASGGRGIVVEQGATLSTLGRGAAALDARTGTYYALTSGALLAVSNGLVNLMAPKGGAGTAIDVGGCVAACGGASLLLSEGSIGAATSGGFTWRDTVQYGTRNLALSVSAVNLGSAQALQQAGAAGHLPPGLEMNQDVLATLLRGNTALGAPALESLILNANESINVYGAVALDARGAGGRSLQRLVLGAPAIYGYGAAGDTATIAAGEFIWAGAIAADRNGINVGATKPQARRRHAGPARTRQAERRGRHDPAGVLAVSAAERSGDGRAPAAGLFLRDPGRRQDDRGSGPGGLSVYHEQDGYNAQDGWRYRGGDLLIRTPLLTGEAGSVMTVKAGGALSVAGTGAAAARDALGATINLAGRSVSLDTTVALPSGKLSIKADDNIALGAGSRIDLAGREVRLFDQLRYSWGGDLELQSMAGDITQAKGALIDVSARNNRAGRVQVIALGVSAGRIDLGGTLRATASGRYDAGGTLVPYEGGEAVLRAQALADFGELNARLTEGGFFGARRFQIKRGDLTVGDELRARNVELVVDGGSLTVNGRIDASGPQVGSIRLAAMGDLVINGALDAHSTTLRVDSYGKIIDSANRAIVDLTSRTGTLSLGAGAQVDLRAGVGAQNNDGVARGTLDLNARRLGGGAERGAIAGSGNGANDVAVSVAGTPLIQGAKTVAVNAFRRYDDAPLAAAPDVTGKRPQEITQGYLDGIDGENQTYMNAALANPAVAARLAGLGAYKLRPGVEVVSATPDGDLTVSGDIDLSNYRYGPGADRLTPARLWRTRRAGAARRRQPEYLRQHQRRLRAAAGVAGRRRLAAGPGPSRLAGHHGFWRRPGGADRRRQAGGRHDVPHRQQAELRPAGRARHAARRHRAARGDDAGRGPVAAGRAGADRRRHGRRRPRAARRHRAGRRAQARAGRATGRRFRPARRGRRARLHLAQGVPLPADLKASAQITLAQGSLIPSQTKLVLLGGKPVDLRPRGRTAGRAATGRWRPCWARAPAPGR